MRARNGVSERSNESLRTNVFPGCTLRGYRRHGDYCFRCNDDFSAGGNQGGEHDHDHQGGEHRVVDYADALADAGKDETANGKRTEKGTEKVSERIPSCREQARWLRASDAPGIVRKNPPDTFFSRGQN